MLRSSFSRAWGRGKVAIPVVATAFALALVTPALAATGGNFVLGVANTATATSTSAGITQLTANIANPAMKLINTSSSTGATALNLQTASNKPPMTTNSSAKVNNLNADKLDGKDSTSFAPAQAAPLWAVVNSDGTLARGKGVTNISKPNTGDYEIEFNRDVTSCAYSATFDHASGFIFVSLRDSSIGPREVGVTTTDRGAFVRDSPFHVVVFC
jgi:hypothetical protein